MNRGLTIRRMAAAAFVIAAMWAEPSLVSQQSAAPQQGAAAKAKPANSPAAAVPVAPDSGRFVVLLDAAHGGDDAGAHLANSAAEKTITLALSVRLRSLLAARGVAVVTTREDNTTLDADARALKANHAMPAACLSLHATETGEGVHLFVSALMPAAPSAFVAWKTAQAAWVTRSLRLASTVNSTLGKSAQGESPEEAVSIPVLLARISLPGLDSMGCPAVAIELAPLRSADGKITADVTDANYQSRVVEALAAAVLSWREEWQAKGRQP